MNQTPEELPLNPHQATPLAGDDLLDKPSREYTLFQGLASTFDRMREDLDAALNAKPLAMGIYDYDKRNKKEERRGQA